MDQTALERKLHRSQSTIGLGVRAGGVVFLVVGSDEEEIVDGGRMGVKLQSAKRVKREQRRLAHDVRSPVIALAVYNLRGKSYQSTKMAIFRKNSKLPLFMNCWKELFQKLSSITLSTNLSIQKESNFFSTFSNTVECSVNFVPVFNFDLVLNFGLKLHFGP